MRGFDSAFIVQSVPLAVQVVQIDDCAPSKLYARHFIRGRARAGVVPRADDEKMFRARFRGRRIREVVPVDT